MSKEPCGRNPAVGSSKNDKKKAAAAPVLEPLDLAADGALNDYLKAHGNQLEMRPRLTMLYHAARGLEHVHSKGIIHRDVAARNCLYGNGVLKLSDFGLSREAKEYNIGHDRMPKQWLSPEVFKTQIFTPQADIWAYGVLVWEIFSNGEEPFAGMPLQAIRKQITEKQYRLPMPDWTPKVVKRMVANTWEEDPKKRRPMREIATEMQELAAGWGSGRVLKNKAVKSQKERSAKAVKSRRTSRERDVPSASSKKTAKKRLSSHRGS
ncbi:TK/FER protein kinase [Aphelenchoides avenae]|nr:TK/FER protein kinase [Aphelenchus avenae]